MPPLRDGKIQLLDEWQRVKAKQVKRLLAADFAAWARTRFDEAIEAAERGETNKVWDLVRQIRGTLICLITVPL